MTTAKRFWIPTINDSLSYAGVNRPGEDTRMLHDYHSNGGVNINLPDSQTGVSYNFGNTLSGSDNKTVNMSHIWKHTSGYTQMGGYCKNDNYISVHAGFINGVHGYTEVRNGRCIRIPGVYGFRFEYRWPSGNHWKNSPVHINDCMMHYYYTSTGNYESFYAHCAGTNQSGAFWPDAFVDSDDRRSDTWRGAYYWVKDVTALNRIINDQRHYWVGVSFEIKYSKRGSASHSRYMDLRNLTPIFGRKSGSNYVPVMAKDSTENWKTNERMAREYYLL